MAFSTVFKLANVIKHADKCISKHLLCILAVHHITAGQPEYGNIQILKELFLSSPLMLPALVYLKLFVQAGTLL